MSEGLAGSQQPNEPWNHTDEESQFSAPSEGSATRVFLFTGTNEDVMRMTAHVLCCAPLRLSRAEGIGETAQNATPEETSDGVRQIIAYDIRSAQDAAGLCVVRTVMNANDSWLASGPEPELVPMDGCCLTCTVKRDVGRVLEDAPTMRDALVVLPAGMEAAPVARYLDEAFMLGEVVGVRPCRVAATIDVEQVVGFKRRLFDNRWFDAGEGLEGGDDERCWGQVVAGLLAESDHVVLLPGIDGAEPEHSGLSQLEAAAAIAETMVSVGAVVHRDVTCVELDDLDGRKRHMAWNESACCDLQFDRRSRSQSLADVQDVMTMTKLAPGVVAMSVRSRRPIHPGRLSAFLQEDCAPLHIRGYFTVPNKPFSTFAWQEDPRGSEIAVMDDVTDATHDPSAPYDSTPEPECKGGRDPRCSDVGNDGSGYGQDRAGDCRTLAHPATELMVVAACDETEGQWPAVYDAIRGLLLTDGEMSRPASLWLDEHDAFTTWMALSHNSSEC